ncbi:MAG: hypothetical protein E6K56_09215 [Ignavibacteria bacterium]|nr:MAG: hypothetical protein E6K56_09215 [Ignavibacteria bacterium]
MRKTLIILFLFSTPLLAQSVHVTARTDSNNILIGDWLALHIEVEHPAGTTILFPQLPDSIEGFEIVRRVPASKKSTDLGVMESATFIVTAFDSGMHVIPPLPVEYTSAGDSTKHSMETLPIPVYVRGIVIDTTKEIKDVKPPLSLPLTLADFLPYLIGIAAAGGLVWLYIYVRGKRRKGESILPEAPERPADELALEALRALESERLWQRGKIKEYHSQLTDILRLYIERRLGVAALELTSDEILSAAPIRLLNNTREALKEILTRADLVKFAKYQPLPEEHETSLRLATGFVESSRVREGAPARAQEVPPATQETPEEMKVPSA